MGQNIDWSNETSEAYILDYDDEGGTTILCGDIIYHTQIKPELSFEFGTLRCETPTNYFFRMIGDNQIFLNDNQIIECINYCINFKEYGDYNVYAYDPNDSNIFQGYILKSKAIENNYLWVTDKQPEQMACSWDDETNNWKYYYAALTEDGSMNVAIDTICPKCVMLFTKEQYDSFPKPEHSTDSYDFNQEKWVDKRNLDDLKHVYILELRNLFEGVRWKVLNEYVPQYEQDTWRIQLDEAKHWLQDNNYETPYIDAFLSARTDDDIPQKEELVQDIINNNNEYVSSIGRINGIQWSFMKRIQKCTTGYEADAIRQEFNDYCNPYLVGVAVSEPELEGQNA